MPPAAFRVEHFRNPALELTCHHVDVGSRPSLQLQALSKRRELGRLGAVISASDREGHPALGLDPGEARIGVAATDPMGILAHPVETIEVGRGGVFERIAVLVGQRGIRTLVVGLPLRMDGSEGEAAAKARRFAGELKLRLPGVPVVMVDESLSTAVAADLLRQSGRKARQQKPLIDQAAAVEILNRWMDPYGTASDLTPDFP